MTRLPQPGPDTRQRPGKVGLGIAHKVIRVGCVEVLIAVAGEDQIIGERAHQRMQPGDHGFALPRLQTFIGAPHTLTATTGQQ